jgi:hypothetical protein
MIVTIISDSGGKVSGHMQSWQRVSQRKFFNFFYKLLACLFRCGVSTPISTKPIVTLKSVVDILSIAHFH